MSLVVPRPSALAVSGRSPSPRDSASPSSIDAYAKLHFQSDAFSYYLQTLTVTIGRRPPPTSPSYANAPRVDIDLGNLKSISRLHATISYDFEREVFVLTVEGRNGLWVEGLWYGKGGRIELGRRTKVQIATRVFYFILPISSATPSPASPATASLSLPPPVPTPAPVSIPVPTPSSAIASTSAAAAAAAADDDDIEVDIMGDFEPGPLRPSPGASGGKGKKKDVGGGGKGKSSKKGKLPASPSPVPSKLAPVATPTPTPTPPPPAAPKATFPVNPLPVPAPAPAPPKPSTSILPPPTIPSPAPPPPLPSTSLLPRTKSSAKKPSLTYAALITRELEDALAGIGRGARRSGRLTLGEICEGIMEKYEWYRDNKDSGWQSSIRHNLSTNKAFYKIERTADEPGKGAFWTLTSAQNALMAAAAAPPPPPTPAPAPAPTLPALPTPSAPTTVAKAARLAAAQAIAASPGLSTLPPETPMSIRVERLPHSADPPPVSLHNKALWLHPEIFAHLTAEQLAHLQTVGAGQAIAILQHIVVQRAKERLKAGRPLGPGFAGITVTVQPKKKHQQAAAAAASSSAPAAGAASAGTSSAATAVQQQTNNLGALLALLQAQQALQQSQSRAASAPANNLASLLSGLTSLSSSSSSAATPAPAPKPAPPPPPPAPAPTQSTGIDPSLALALIAAAASRPAAGGAPPLSPQVLLEWLQNAGLGGVLQAAAAQQAAQQKEKEKRAREEAGEGEGGPAAKKEKLG